VDVHKLEHEPVAETVSARAACGVTELFRFVRS
jgi:hypothetical protein